MRAPAAAPHAAWEPTRRDRAVGCASGEGGRGRRQRCGGGAGRERGRADLREEGGHRPAAAPHPRAGGDDVRGWRGAKKPEKSSGASRGRRQVDARGHGTAARARR
jgi:hypothetical protein